MTMTNISVHRYPVPSDEERATWPPDTQAVSDTWQGWIEPDDRTWIMFVGADGRPVVFLDRDPETGAVR